MTKKALNTKIGSLYLESDRNREVSINGQNGYRTDFRRDYARLVHSPAFRRLQGKTQLFPGVESDFFRNRLTHSQEVAQIAKTLALKINFENNYFKKNNIDTDLVELAALAHDLGHPPFGHNGEEALDECMREFGGFEGNAQTLRILARLEKKERVEGQQIGLNLTHRTLGALLKYDRVIPIKNKARGKKWKDKVMKGYYKSEADLVERAKFSMLGTKKIVEDFKTIECSIMDTADDIAYSTYDLEDAFKAGFADPLEVLRYAHNRDFLDKIVEKVDQFGGIKVTQEDVQNILISTFGAIIVESFENTIDEVAVIEKIIKSFKKTGSLIPSSYDRALLIETVVNSYKASKEAASDGYERSGLTSALVNEFINGVKVSAVNSEFPVLTKLEISEPIRKKIGVLKHFTYEAMIMSPRLKIVEHRGKEVVKRIFEELTDPDTGHLLLPDDFRAVFYLLETEMEKKRLVCDFIAGMTDRYAIEFYGRLTSVVNGHTFFKPL